MAEINHDNQAPIAHRRSPLTTAILKAMSIFGGLQAVQIICSIIRVKLVATWIGPVGVGLFGIYNSVIEMIGTLAQSGLRNSAVRDVASSSHSRLAIIILVVRRWSWMIGLAGAVITIALSPLLSQLTFDDTSHTGSFVALSVVILLVSITSGEQAVMQGMQKLRRLAISSMWGVIAGLAISIPLFYWLRIDSIIPSLIAYALVGTIASLCYRAPSPKPHHKISLKETVNEGRSLIVLGFYMTISIFIGMLASYIFISYLNITSSTTEVGYYQAGYTLFNRYVGLIFTAISMEFFPRLASSIKSQQRTSLYVSHEAGLIMWILNPNVCLFITFADPIVRFLYASEFTIIVPFITWGIVGTILRALSWCMAFTMLAKGDGKVYLITESLSAISYIAIYIIVYNLWGVNGLGIAYILWYLLYTIVVAMVYRYRYNLSISKRILWLTSIAMLICSTAALSSLHFGWQIPAILSIITLLLSARHIAPLFKK